MRRRILTSSKNIRHCKGRVSCLLVVLLGTRQVCQPFRQRWYALHGRKVLGFGNDLLPRQATRDAGIEGGSRIGLVRMLGPAVHFAKRVERAFQQVQVRRNGYGDSFEVGFAFEQIADQSGNFVELVGFAVGWGVRFATGCA